MMGGQKNIHKTPTNAGMRSQQQQQQQKGLAGRSGEKKSIVSHDAVSKGGLQQQQKFGGDHHSKFAEHHDYEEDLTQLSTGFFQTTYGI